MGVRERVRAEIAGETVLTGFLRTAGRAPDEHALRWKSGDTWQGMTWREYRQAVAEVAAGLCAVGARRGECVVIYSRNRPEPQIADLAVQAAGGVPVSVPLGRAPRQIAGIVDHCAASVAIVEDQATAEVFMSVGGLMPRLQHLVILDGAADPGRLDGGLTTVSWAGLRERGATAVTDPAGYLTAAAQRLDPDDLATLIYTSGSSGEPKAVMITHRNVRWVFAAGFIDEEPTQGERIISYLSLGTTGGRVVDHWGHAVLGGATVFFCPDRARLIQYAREIRPTLLLGVPAVWADLYKDINARIDSEPEPERTALRQCLAVGAELARRRASGAGIPAGLQAAADRGSRSLEWIRAQVGLDKCTRAVSGGAPIDPAIIEFFQSLGMFMTQSWGMTELTAAVTSGGPNGTVGRPYPGVEIRLAGDGEILVRGGLVMKGYYHDDQQTAQVMADGGWLRTGDIGTFDQDGHLSIVGRKKDIIVTSLATNVAPAMIEIQLERHPLIGHALVVGEAKPYITALLTLDGARAPGWAAEHGIAVASLHALAAHPEVIAEVQRWVTGANNRLSRVEQVRGFQLLADQWSVGTGELTPTFKKRRPALLERYAAQIAGNYPDVA